MNKLTDKQIGYIIDGEGCIGISKKSNKNEYKCHISVCNTNKDLIYYLREITGIGRTSLYRVESSRWKPQWKWDLRKYEVKKFLSVITDSLVIKKDQAYYVMKFLETCDIKYNIHNRLPYDIILTREALYEEMAILNKRGRTVEEVL